MIEISFLMATKQVDDKSKESKEKKEEIFVLFHVSNMFGVL
jgi:hypothetical protein